MRCDLKSRSCFSSVLGYPGLAVVEELGSDGTMWTWFVGNVFAFDFCHMVISGASWS